MICGESRVQGIVQYLTLRALKKISSSTEILHCSCFLNVSVSYKDLWLGYIFPKRLMSVSSGILEIFQESSSSSHSLFPLIHKLVQRELKCIPPLPSLHLRMRLTTKLCCKLSFLDFLCENGIRIRTILVILRNLIESPESVKEQSVYNKEVKKEMPTQWKFIYMFNACWNNKMSGFTGKRGICQSSWINATLNL